MKNPHHPIHPDTEARSMEPAAVGGGAWFRFPPPRPDAPPSPCSSSTLPALPALGVLLVLDAPWAPCPDRPIIIYLCVRPIMTIVYHCKLRIHWTYGDLAVMDRRDQALPQQVVGTAITAGRPGGQRGLEGQVEGGAGGRAGTSRGQGRRQGWRRAAPRPGRGGEARSAPLCRPAWWVNTHRPARKPGGRAGRRG